MNICHMYVIKTVLFHIYTYSNHHSPVQFYSKPHIPVGYSVQISWKRQY